MGLLLLTRFFRKSLLALGEQCLKTFSNFGLFEGFSQHSYPAAHSLQVYWFARVQNRLDIDNVLASEGNCLHNDEILRRRYGKFRVLHARSCCARDHLMLEGKPAEGDVNPDPVVFVLEQQHSICKSELGGVSPSWQEAVGLRVREKTFRVEFTGENDGVYVFRNPGFSHKCYSDTAHDHVRDVFAAQPCG